MSNCCEVASSIISVLRVISCSLICVKPSCDSYNAVSKCGYSIEKNLTSDFMKILKFICKLVMSQVELVENTDPCRTKFTKKTVKEVWVPCLTSCFFLWDNYV